MKNIRQKINVLALTALIIGASSCKKEYLETTPSDSVSGATIYGSTQAAEVALNGMIRTLWVATATDLPGQKGVDMTMDLMGNDMVVNSAGYGWFNADYGFRSQASAANGSKSDNIWRYYYTVINNANRLIANIDAATGSQADKDYLKGNALFLRAHSYFYLANLFQQTYVGHENSPGVPLYTEPTSEGNPRGTLKQDYDQIVADLTEAETLLTGKSRHLTSHINVAVVQGMRARVALQMGDYATAATKANSAKVASTLMTNSLYTNGFGIQNSEWLWGVKIQNDQSSIYASFFSHIDPTTFDYAQLGTQKKITKALYDQIPSTDVRKTVFRAEGTGTSLIPDYSSLKFRLPVAGSWEGDYVFMRGSEMYLIEAEALARQGGKDAQALGVLTQLVTKRDPSYAKVLTGQALIDEILIQRRIELWGEGFSLLDIKRLNQPLTRPSGTGNHQVNLAVIFSLPANDPQFLLRIPQREINSNDAVTAADQNP